MGPPARIRAVAIAVAALLAAAPQALAAPRSALFRGTGVWVDVYDRRYHPHPEALVAAAARHHVRVIYVQSGNAGRAEAVVDAAALDRLVPLAHRRGIAVVAWYLPDLVDVARDHRRLRAAAAIGSRGQRVDGIALDIESSAVADPALRTVRLVRLARVLRRELPRRPLGAIIPSPPGLARLPDYWPGFPYRRLAAVADAFLPMCYASYRAFDARESRAYGRRCVTLIRAATGARPVIHVLAGIAGELPADEAWALANAAADARADGFSLYDLITTDTGGWHAVSHWTARAARY